MKWHLLILVILFLLINFYFIQLVYAFDTRLINNIGQGATPPELVKNIYNFSMLVGGIIAVGVIVYAGILRIFSSGNPKKIQESNSYITGAIFGLLLLFGASILFNTINPRIANLTFAMFRIQVPNPPPRQSQVESWPQPLSDPSYQLDDATARCMLQARGISVNKSNCTYIGQTNCTSLDGITATAVHGAIQLAQLAKKNNKNITITGGTEYWLHKTHGPGKSILDIHYDKDLINDVKNLQSGNTINSWICEKGSKDFGQACDTNDTDHFHIVFSGNYSINDLKRLYGSTWLHCLYNDKESDSANTNNSGSN
ncbi:MAG: pilin [Minisyncoccia bacterium]